MKTIKKVLVFLCLTILFVGSFSRAAVFADDISLLSITKTYGDGPFTLNFSSSGGKVTYSTSNKKVVTVSNKGKVSIKGCGISEIRVRSAANEKYKEKNTKITIIVKPKKQNITEFKIDKRNILLKWKKDTKADGYYIYYSTDYKFSNDLQKVKVAKNKTTSNTLTKLKTGKKYYVKICSYKKSGNQEVLGDFSSIRNVKIQ